MKTSHINLLVGLGPLLLAAGASAAKSKSTTINCFTSYGSGRVKHVTSSTTRVTSTLTATNTVIETPTTTFTPDATTDTVTDTAITTSTTTLAQNTDTITETKVETDTMTITADTTTLTESDTTTTTSTSTGTSTIPTPSGFLPIQSTLPQSANVKRGLQEVKLASDAGTVALRAGGSASKPESGSFPQAVSCVKIIYVSTSTVVTSTAESTSTVTDPTPTDTTTITQTDTVVETTQPGDASTTITDTTTVLSTAYTTPSTTTTTTLTQTEVSLAPAATFYAQCDTANFADSAQGRDITSFQKAAGVYNFKHDITSAYDCCVACALDPKCDGAAFDATQGFCAVGESVGSTCSAGQDDITAVLGGAVGSGNHQVGINGVCGFVDKTAVSGTGSG